MLLVSCPPPPPRRILTLLYRSERANIQSSRTSKAVLFSELVGLVGRRTGFQPDTLGVFSLVRRITAERLQWLVSRGPHAATEQPDDEVNDNWYQDYGQDGKEHPEKVFHHRTLFVVPLVSGAVLRLEVTRGIECACLRCRAPVAKMVFFEAAFAILFPVFARGHSNCKFQKAKFLISMVHS